MTDTRQDVTLYRGYDAVIRFPITAEPGGEGGPINVAGWAFEWRLAASPGAAPLLTKTSAASQIVVTGDSSLGIVDVLVSKDDPWSGIPAGRYWHELKLIDTAAMQVPGAIGSAQVRDTLEA